MYYPLQQPYYNNPNPQQYYGYNQQQQQQQQQQQHAYYAQQQQPGYGGYAGYGLREYNTNYRPARNQRQNYKSNNANPNKRTSRPKKPPRGENKGSVSNSKKNSNNSNSPNSRQTLSPQAASFVTPLTQSDIDLNTLRSQLRSSEISNLSSLPQILSVNVCKGNDRYIVVQIMGSPDTPYAGGKYDVEVFFGKGYPKVFPQCRLATKIGEVA